MKGLLMLFEPSVSDANNNNLLRKFVGVLISTSGVTHVLQYWVYAPEQRVLAAVALASGFVLLILGPSLLLRQSAGWLWFAITLHTVVAPAHIYRIVFMVSTPITIFHFVVVCLVVPTCAYLLFNQSEQPTEPD